MKGVRNVLLEEITLKAACDYSREASHVLSAKDLAGQNSQGVGKVECGGSLRNRTTRRCNLVNLIL